MLLFLLVPHTVIELVDDVTVLLPECFLEILGGFGDQDLAFVVLFWELMLSSSSNSNSRSLFFVLQSLHCGDFLLASQVAEANETIHLADEGHIAVATVRRMQRLELFGFKVPYVSANSL